MNQQEKHILLIDDDEDDYILIRERLGEAGGVRYRVEWAATLQAGQETMKSVAFDAILVDYRLGAQTGIDLIRESVAAGYHAPILLLTGQGNYEIDLEAMEAGAADYLNKTELNSSLLERSIRYAIERKQHEEELRKSEEALRESENRFRIALSNTKITVFSTDQELRYTWVFSAMMGAEADEFVGKRDDAFLTEPDANLLISLKRKALEDQVAVSDEVEIHLNGEEKILIVTIEPFQQNGSIRGVIGAYYDVTFERRMERERIRHRMDMEVQRRLTEHREKERQAIARELHDGPVQSLSSLIFNLEFLKQGVEDPGLANELDSIRASLRENVRNLRELMNELRPPSLIRFGLGKAIQFHLENFREKYNDLSVDLQIQDDVLAKPLSEQVNLNLYRIYSEAMMNIVRHSHATYVQIRLETDGNQLVMVIRDNGTGFLLNTNGNDPNEENHYGLVVMKERAEMINAEVLVQSEIGQGTVIEVRVSVAD